jgi:hypothetical protein
VQKGQLRVTVTSTSGKEATLALVGAGDFLAGCGKTLLKAFVEVSTHKGYY